MGNERKSLPDSYTICMYMRLSNEDDFFPRGKEESGSITAQRGLIQNYIRQHDEFKKCRVIERFDDGLSGRYFDSRPAFTEMIELCKKGKVNCIIVKDCSRFGRDYVELGNYLEQVFPFLGIRFISVNDHYDSDLQEGGLDIAFKNLVYDYYSRELSKKEKIAKTRLAKQGKYSSVQAIYGYQKKADDKHSLEIDPEAAEVVKEIFAMRLKGTGPALIARELNKRGILCPTDYRLSKGWNVVHRKRKGLPCWLASQVFSILTNEEYTGAVVAHKNKADPATGKSVPRPIEERIVVHDMHEAIVSKEDFEAVQKMICREGTRKLEKKIFYQCGICGRTLDCTSANMYCKRKGVVPDSECARLKMNKAKADAAVLQDLKAAVTNLFTEQDRQLKMKSKGISPEAELKDAEKRLQTVEKAKRMLFEKLADRSVDRENFKTKKAGYDLEIERLKEKIKIIRATMDEEAEMDVDRSILGEKELTKEIWDRYIESVEVFPGERLTVKFKF
ncbi:MAG: recombinase family protein [Lachnospiraceae bacterium]|nr:recombinase family protein [Lachnospiraceae bacterium]